MSTFMAKPQTIQRRWLVIDATDQVVGRLAVQIANILRGKHRPEYTPHIDTGEFVIVTNVEKIRFTGKKLESKTYHWYTRYPGGDRGQSVYSGCSGVAFPEKIERCIHPTACA